MVRRQPRLMHCVNDWYLLSRTITGYESLLSSEYRESDDQATNMLQNYHIIELYFEDKDWVMAIVWGFWHG